MVTDRHSLFDEYMARCPMLGHLVRFTYCREPGADLPCRKIMDCWHERIDIVAYLKEILSPEEIESLLAPPKQKVTHLVELIKKAKGE
jgi:hypothetical protein